MFRFLMMFNCLVFFASSDKYSIDYILIPVISSRAGGRKFQKKKETIGRSGALLIFAPHTRVLHLSAISLNERIPPIKLALSFSKNLYF